MRPQAPLAVLAGILTLAVCAAVILVVESRHPGPAHAGEFQQLVGGLGFGPALGLSRCPNSFDPRLCHRCPEDLGPVPGGGVFCPHHACSLFDYPALDSAH